MCPCDLANEFVCRGCEDYIEDLICALKLAERCGDDDQRQLRGQIARIGLKAEIVKLRMAQRTWERENA
jgi:hypothetical protein